MNKLLQSSALAVLFGTASGVAHADLMDGTTLGGKMYLDVSNLSQSLDGHSGTADGFGFDVKRFYFSVDHRFDSTWSIDLTTDFHYSSSDGKSTLFVKKAYVQGAFDPLFVLRAGSADMPWIPYEEHLYGFRYVEQTVEDRFGLANSADWGLHAMGKKGIFDYQLSVVSGGGYSHVNDRSKRPDVALRLGVQPIENLTVAAGIYDGKRGQQTGTGTAAAPTPTREEMLYHVLVGYVGDGWRLGGEYFVERNPVKYADGSFGGTGFPFVQSNAILANGQNAEDRADGYSLWAAYEVTKPLTLFARFDHVRPSRDVDPSLRDTYFNVGAQYTVRKGIDIALVYKHDKLRDSVHKLTNNEIGLFSQIAF